MPTRRSFLQSVALTAVGVATTPAWATNRFSAAPPALRIRRNFNSLDPNGPEVAALRAGIQAMRSLDPSAGIPTSAKSWGYQRGIHKYPSPPPSPLPTAWNTCTHHGFPGPAFLSWHRGYLYYFERICRAASGYDAFTLPYWNYDKAGQSALPSPFYALPHDSTANPFYYSPRSINDGSEIALGSRGEQDTISTVDFTQFQDAIQGCHDRTHGAVGGDMGSVPTAALDPIFYLHHCNIDRCWRHWQINNLNNADPSPLPSWWNTVWTFFDDSGVPVPITGQQAEHTPNLGYVYDDEMKFVRPSVIQLGPYIRNLCQRFPILCRRLEIPVRPPWPLPWPLFIAGDRPTSLPLRLPVEQTKALWEVKRRTGRSSDNGLLTLELIIGWQEGSPNLLAEARPASDRGDADWVPAGAVGSFARGGDRDRVAIDVSRLFGLIDAASSRHDLEWRLRFTSGRVGADGHERPLADTKKAQARIWAAKLTVPRQDMR
jgi:hypothetical protein